MCGCSHDQHNQHNRHEHSEPLQAEDLGMVEVMQSPKKTGLAAFLLLFLVKGYRYGISPLFPPSCRYVPTCSEYAVEAIARYGALRGGWLSLSRILRCHPFVAGGYDPVE